MEFDKLTSFQPIFQTLSLEHLVFSTALQCVQGFDDFASPSSDLLTLDLSWGEVKPICKVSYGRGALKFP